ncbi:MAG: TonB-dependent receptor plug domain-containing protein [Bacteroidetes bacterium]|nr:TonB-dependent receptor plug domain-containing protein [Bacteroidota bacterium]
MKKLLIASLFLISGYTLRAQTGRVSGVVGTDDGKKVSGVRVFAIGSLDTSWTDPDGHYHILLPLGSQTLVFSGRNYEEELDSVEVGTEELFLNKTLIPIQTVRDARIKVARKIKDQNTIIWSVDAKAKAPGLIETIGSQEIGRTTARSTGDVIKRIPGATIQDGKFANIRGMYDRYNASYLNGAPLPSTESDRKAFSFDIIPATLLDNIIIIKSGTPDMTGDFGGGIIRINTKNIPDKKVQSFSFGIQYNSLTSFREIQSFGISGSEYFGIPGNQRNIPNLSGTLYDQSKLEFNSEETKKFNNNWNISTVRPVPSPRFNYSIGVPFKLKGQKEIGLLASLNYSITQKYSDGIVQRNDLSDNRALSSYNDKLFSSNVQNGGILNLSVKLNNKNRVDWKNLMTINYDASSTFRKGVSDYENQVDADGYSNLVNFNRLMSTQLNGTHILGEKQNTLTWLVNYGNTNREIPDFRIAQYATVEKTDRYLVLNDFFNAGSGRFFSNLSENTWSASVEMKHNFKLGRMVSNLKYGAFYQNRNRNFTSREFVYGPVGKSILTQNTPSQDLSNEGISGHGIYLVEKTAIDLDNYSGNAKLYAGFVMMENNYPLFYSNKKPNYLKLIYGVRMEQFTQILTNDIFTKIYKKDVSNAGTINDFLPSINMTAPITSKTGLRLAYYKTLNRPEMRELAPFSFYNFNLNSEVIGNPNLKRAVLHNLDVRFELFPGKEDMLTVGAFAKRIINPIEFSLDPTQATIRTFTYRNEKSAEIRGVELEMRKKLAFIGNLFGDAIFKNLSLYGNFAIIRSSVQFNQNSTGVQNRPLQGQSPYVANVSLYYDHAKSGLSMSLNYNKIGSRIAYIGVSKEIQPYGADIYEYGRGIVDFQISKQLGKNGKHGNIKLTAGDLLAQKTIYYQDLNANGKYEKGTDNMLFGFTNGRTLTISYGYSF